MADIAVAEKLPFYARAGKPCGVGFHSWEFLKQYKQLRGKRQGSPIFTLIPGSHLVRNRIRKLRLSVSSRVGFHRE